MSEAKRSWLGLAAVQLFIVLTLVTLHFSPRVRLAGLSDAPEAIVYRWLPAHQRKGKSQPRVEAFEGGFALHHRGRGKNAYALDHPRLESLDLSRPFTITALVRPDRKPKTRGVIVAAQQKEERIFELGLNRKSRAYVELRPKTKKGPLLTADSKRLPGHSTVIAMVFDPGKRLSLYLDGALSIELTGKTVPLSLGAKARWWASNRKDSKNAFPGMIGTIAIYPRALSAGEIEAEVVRAGVAVNKSSFPPRKLPEKKTKKSKLRRESSVKARPKKP